MRPKLLDLFCGAGGAGMGYHRAGFEVHGCDLHTQKRYPFPVLQMDWREYLGNYGHLFDCFHASPECQGYSVLKHMTTKAYNMEIDTVREALRATGKPFVIENVMGAKKFMQNPTMLCGSMFGLQTSCGAQLRRHRLFETSFDVWNPPKCQHGPTTQSVVGHAYRNEAERMRQRTIGVTGTGNALSGAAVISVHGGRDHERALRGDKRTKTVTITGSTPQQNVERNVLRETFSIEEARLAMGIDWMVMKELSQAIPPAYTEWIGKQLREVL